MIFMKTYLKNVKILRGKTSKVVITVLGVLFFLLKIFYKAIHNYIN